MTCIVAVKQDGKIWMGGDSLGSAGWNSTVRKDPKVFINDKFLIGFTTSYRMGQLLMSRHFNPPPQQIGVSNFEYMITDFVDAVQTLFRDKKYTITNSGQEQGGQFLVGYKGEIYCLEDDFQVGVAANNYDAVGCGATYAKGALFILSQSSSITGNLKVDLALKAADAHSNGVGGPVTILSQSIGA